MPAPRHPGRAPSRRELERLTAELAAFYGWQHHHLLVADRLEGGYPFGFATEVLARDGRAVFVFYTLRNRPPTHAQQRWISALREVRVIEPLVIAADQTRELVRALEPGPSIEADAGCDRGIHTQQRPPRCTVTAAGRTPTWTPQAILPAGQT